MESRNNTPHRAIAHQTCQTEGEHVAHKHRACRLAQGQCSSHASSNRSHLARGLLPGSQSRGLRLFCGRGFSCSGRWGWRRCRWSSGWENLAVQSYDRASHDLVGEIDSKVLFLVGERQQKLGYIVRIESRRLCRETRGQIRVSWRTSK